MSNNQNKHPFMTTVTTLGPGLLLCLGIALPSYLLGQRFPIIGGAVIALLTGMLLSILHSGHSVIPTACQAGIRYTAKKILQLAVILLGFGLNLRVLLSTGRTSLPIILSTVTTALVTAYVLARLLHIPSRIATLIGVGSSICGGSAIAATAPVIEADDREVAQAISVIFFFNVLAALVFPSFGALLGFSTVDGSAFGLFAGTAVNDTSSVTAAASSWDAMWGLGTATLDTAVTVKLTRTLAIIPITLGLSLYRMKKTSHTNEKKRSVKLVPLFIIFFILASVVTTVAARFGIDPTVFSFCKTASKFFIVMAMAAIGLGTNPIALIKSGARPLALGAACWTAITAVSLLLQWLLGLW